MVAIGINEQNIGVVKAVGNIKLMLPPSYAAEAFIGRTSRRELKSALERCVEEASSDSFAASFPTLARWVREEGNISWDDLEARVRQHYEGMAHLLSGQPMKTHSRSGANVDYARIKRRGDARKGPERSRSTTLVLDEDGQVVDYADTCFQFTTGFVRGNYDDAHFDGNGAAGFVTHVACYHINVDLFEADSIPYVFSDMRVVLESLAMKIFRKSERDTFERDRYLLKNSILTDETRNGIADGRLAIEVIWNRRNIPGRAKSILSGMKSYFEQKAIGYRFAGFALDFFDTPYETTAVVLVKPDGRSVHLLLDESLKSGEMPFTMLRIPKTLWLEEGRPADVEPLMMRNPVLYSAGKRYFEDFDMRTQSEVISIVDTPRANLLRPEERRGYERIFSTAA